MDSLQQDLRYGLRAMGKSPGFTAIAVLTLALGIGANTAIFSVLDGVVLRPLPYPDSDRLVWMWGSFQGSNRASVSPPDFADYRAQNQSFERFAAAMSLPWQANLTGNGEPEQVQSSVVTAGFFETLGVAPELGRTFQPTDEQFEEPQAVILSHSLWVRRYSSDPHIVGGNIVMNGRGLLVAGVMPAGFDFPKGTQLWQAAPFRAPGFQVRRFHFLRPIGRLKPGVTLQQAQAEMDTIAKRLEQQHPESNQGWTLGLVGLREQMVGNAKPALLVMMAGVGVVLLIACANVANLMLGRATSRRKEMAIRAALGARGSRLARQLLTESLVLALAGGALGILLAIWGVDFLRLFAPANLPRIEEVTVNLRTLGFALAASLLTGLLFGIGPGLAAARSDLNENLKESGRTTAGTRRSLLRSGLVVSEVTLSLALLVCAGLLARSFVQLVRVDPGFRADHVLATQILLPVEKYPEPRDRAAFFRSALEKIEALPGVESAATVTELPLSGQTNDTYFWIVGDSTGEQLDAHFRTISPKYFQTMGIPLQSGRTFTEQDGARAPGAVIVDESFVRRFFPSGNPVGRHLVIDLGQPFPAEIVGVVGGIHHFTLQASPPPLMYIPFAQSTVAWSNVVIRTSTEPSAIAPAVRQAVWAVDKDQALGDFRTMEGLVDQSLAQPRFGAALLGFFAGVALALAAVGIYGVMAFSVTQRLHEIGVRVALGAQRSDILRLVLGQGMKLAGIGAVLGVMLAFFASRLLEGLLFGVTARDPATFAGVAALLGLVALVACYVPARRATRVDPIVTLRYE